MQYLSHFSGYMENVTNNLFLYFGNRGGGMAGVKKKDIPDIAAFMPEFWEFVKSVWIPEDSDQYWKEVYDKAQELYQKYPVDFVKRQILGFCEYLDQKWQDERDKAGTEVKQ